MARFLYCLQKASSRTFYFDWATWYPCTHPYLWNIIWRLGISIACLPFEISTQVRSPSRCWNTSQIDKWFSEVPGIFIYHVNSRKPNNHFASEYVDEGRKVQLWLELLMCFCVDIWISFVGHFWRNNLVPRLTCLEAAFDWISSHQKQD